MTVGQFLANVPSIRVIRDPYSISRRKAIMGYMDSSGRNFIATALGWRIMNCADEDEKQRMMEEAHLRHDMDVASEQLAPFRETLEAFGVAEAA